VELIVERPAALDVHKAHVTALAYLSDGVRPCARPPRDRLHDLGAP
jgi:hypothetical protein